MKIKKLFKDLDVEIKGSKEIEITGISSHSQFVSPGSLFIAKKGKTFDGSDFIPKALEAGAHVILTDIYNPFLTHVVQVIAKDIATLEPLLAKRYYEDPAASLFMVGITGTNGKTTTAYLVQHLLGNCGLMGTIETIIGKQKLPAQLTTSDVITNYKMLREMVDQKMEAAVMEVTSHALDQNRVKGIIFDVGIFTNLSQDHLDYHGSMEIYQSAKMQLANQVKHLVINRDDSAWESLKGITYALEAPADFRATDIEESLDGTRFIVHHQNKAYPFETKLIGIYNIYNCLAAIAVGHLRGHRFSTLQKKLASFEGVPGRLERIMNPKGLHLFVDFAHTAQALESVLSTLKKMKQGKIITVFGCGGERDRDKRPKMACAAEKFSDQVIVTSDNPRSEDPAEICKEVAQGLRGEHLIEVDRRRAIERGIYMAQKGDIVLIAGRGHEPFQKIGGRLIPFDDREVAREITTAID
ncbi:MAG: UDP-N-acetylmuramoyl-L-alanyl-D-glutamate--2,6-diaminopimelate ligase [Simkaniaceae bacterium]